MPYFFDKTRRQHCITLYVDGKQRFVRSKFVTHERFKNKTEAMDYEMTAMAYYNKKKSSAMSLKISCLGDAYLKFLGTINKTTTVYTRMQIYKEYIYPYFAKYTTDQITNEVIISYNEYLNSLKRKNKKNIFSTVRSFFKFLTSYGININLLLLYQYRNKNVDSKKTFNIITKTQFDDFVSVVESKRDLLLFSLLFYFGLRITEALGLKWSDIKTDRLYIRRCVTAKTYLKKQTIVQPKSSSSIRDYTIPEQVRIAIDGYSNSYKHSNNDFVFPSDREQSLVIGVSTVTRLKDDYFNKIGIAPIKLHEFRHSCATYLLTSGIPPRIVASWLGHKSELVTLSTYSHLIPGDKEKISDFLNDADSKNTQKLYPKLYPKNKKVR